MSRGGAWPDAWGAGLDRGLPWYRRSSLWLMAVAALVPFGWMLPLCRLAWARVASRRDRHF